MLPLCSVELALLLPLTSEPLLLLSSEPLLLLSSELLLLSASGCFFPVTVELLPYWKRFHLTLRTLVACPISNVVTALPSH